jgi:hypothetical protein
MGLNFDAERFSEVQKRIGNSLVINVPLVVQRKLATDANDRKSEKAGLTKNMQLFVLNLMLCTPLLNIFAMQHKNRMLLLLERVFKAMRSSHPFFLSGMIRLNLKTLKEIIGGEIGSHDIIKESKGNIER